LSFVVYKNQQVIESRCILAFTVDCAYFFKNQIDSFVLAYFTAGQAAQKRKVLPEIRQANFTAGQAAQKTTVSRLSNEQFFTAGQAAQKQNADRDGQRGNPSLPDRQLRNVQWPGKANQATSLPDRQLRNERMQPDSLRIDLHCRTGSSESANAPAAFG
jgi:hypothetical protein